VGSTGSGKTTFVKKALAKIAAKSYARILVYSPTDFTGWPHTATVTNNIEDLCRLIREYLKSDRASCHVVIDEFARIQNTYGSFSKYPIEIQELTSLYRHYGITAWICAQRPKMIHPNIREQCAEKVIFRLNAHIDRKTIQDDCGIDLYDGKPLAQSIGELDTLQAFVINGDAIQCCKIRL
jgi:DNA helicase HerA-like ATPase